MSCAGVVVLPHRATVRLRERFSQLTPQLEPPPSDARELAVASDNKSGSTLVSKIILPTGWKPGQRAERVPVLLDLDSGRSNQVRPLLHVGANQIGERLGRAQHDIVAAGCEG